MHPSSFATCSRHIFYLSSLPCFQDFILLLLPRSLLWAINLPKPAQFFYLRPTSHVVLDHPQVQWFTNKTHLLQHILVFMAMSCYSKKIQSLISQGKRHMGWNPEETRPKLPRILSQWNPAGLAQLLPQVGVTIQWNVVYQQGSLPRWDCWGLAT